MQNEWGTMNAYGILVGKPEEKITVGSQICRWTNDIKMDHER
jgi:hypothetical protein